MSTALTPRERRLINAALSAFATAIAVTEVDNGVDASTSDAAEAAERHDDLRRYFAALGRVAPTARTYARTRYAHLTRAVARGWRLP